MTNLITTIKSVTNPTEAKIRKATSKDKNGPNNQELMDLSLLTYHPKHLASILDTLAKRLAVVESAISRERFVLKKSKTTQFNNTNTIPNKRSSTSFRRARSFDIAPDSNSITDEKDCLRLLKTITVILYLIQNGSEPYMNWIQKSYTGHISQINSLTFPKMYQDTLKYKARRIVQLCSDPEELRQFRINIHKLRNAVTKPGVKRSSSEIYSRNDIEIKEVQISYTSEPSDTSAPNNKFATLSTLSEEASVLSAPSTPVFIPKIFSPATEGATLVSLQPLNKGSNPFRESFVN